MAPTDSTPDHSGAPADHTTEATVFGLRVRASRPIPCLQDAGNEPGRHCLELKVEDCDPAEVDWPAGAGVICSRRERGEAESFRIESHPQAGYLIWGWGRGSFVLSSDGTRLRCLVGGIATAAWGRFLVGQVLPFSALVSGMEILHASAVVRGGGAVGFGGPSGVGKTSVALAMCDRGSAFLADDVLSLEPRGLELFAHPGAPLAALARAEAERRRAIGRALPGEVVMVDAREEVVRVAAGPEAARLEAFFFLDRRPDGPSKPRFQPVERTQDLLTATFNFALTTPQRLRGLLEVCALLSQRRVERITTGPQVGPGDLAAAVALRLADGR